VRPVSAVRAPMRGFTLIELMIGVAILALLLAIGIPSMRSWMASSKALSATEFYAEGLRLARAEAVKRNAVTRFTLTDNSTNDQLDWQIDLCVPTPAALCTASTGSWSTTSTAANGTAAADFRSLLRVANNLPSSNLMTMTRFPAGAVAVYFMPTGWVDGTITPSLNKIQLAPTASQAGQYPSSAVVVTLAGVVTKCDPTVSTGDSRKCPP
jgi:type IV fimbrial biogenesis protein FimT